MTPFLKMHGLGNDFVVFDARHNDIALDATDVRALADRRFGIGCDQVIVIAPSAKEVAMMRIYNADGGEVESCGNAARCVAKLLAEETGQTTIRLETLARPIECHLNPDDTITVDMGTPSFAWDQVPLAVPTDTHLFNVNVDGIPYAASALSTGNPHCVLFVDDAELAPVGTLGPRIETHPMFPSRTNVEFVHPLSRNRLRMRVWERGAGITKACGTGACAAVVAAHRRGLVGRKVDVELDGGVLTIEFREEDGHMMMSGPAALAYRGEVDLAAIKAGK